jgi:hypothetical protein
MIRNAPGNDLTGLQEAPQVVFHLFLVRTGAKRSLHLEHEAKDVRVGETVKRSGEAGETSSARTSKARWTRSIWS